MPRGWCSHPPIAQQASTASAKPWMSCALLAASWSSSALSKNQPNAIANELHVFPAHHDTFERMSTSGLPLCRTSSLRTSPVAWVGGAATRDRIGAFLPLEGAPYVIHPNSRAFALAA